MRCGLMRCGRSREMMKAAHKAGSRAWWYHFRATPLYSENMGNIPYMGAFHGAEVRSRGHQCSATAVTATATATATTTSKVP